MAHLSALFRTSTALALSLLLAGCGSRVFSVAVKPTREPMYNMTQGSKLLSCVGSYVDRTDVPPIDVYISDIPDHTTPTIESGFITKNAVMMVTTAIDRLGSPKIQIVGKNGANPRRHQVQVMGAFTELNRTVHSNAANGKSVWPFGVKFDLGGDESVNHMALDMAMSEFNRIIPTTTTSVSIQVYTDSGNTTLTYDAGGSFAAVAALGFTAQEGFHAAERLLIETSVAVMVSRYYKLDITNCLEKNKKTEAPKNGDPLDRPVYPDPEKAGDRPASMEDQDSVIPMKPSTKPSAFEEETAPKRPSLVMDNSPVNLRSEPRKLPTEEDVVVIPRHGKKPRVLEEQPEEYQSSHSDGFSGVYKKGQSGSFVDR